MTCFDASISLRVYCVNFGKLVYSILVAIAVSVMTLNRIVVYVSTKLIW